jgi:hypothetical protein
LDGSANTRPPIWPPLITKPPDDFLDPFFAALGWDLNNSSGYAQAYRDVIKEESLRTSEGVKAPDFITETWSVL